MKYSTKLLTTFFALFFFVNQSAFAETLTFKVGDNASYTITQKLTTEWEGYLKSYGESTGSIDVDIEILSVNQETLSYPFDVVLTLRRVDLLDIERDEDDKSPTTVYYNSERLKILNNTLLVDHFDKLINHPLIFRIKNEFQVEEISGYFERLDDALDNPCLSFLTIGVSPITYELFLKQLFHFSGDNLQLNGIYPKSSYQFLNLSLEEEIGFFETSAYTVNAMDSKTIEATWQGDAEIENSDPYSNLEISLTGNVIWDRSNLIIQKRNLNLQFQHTFGTTPIRYKYLLQQTWQSK